MNHNHHIAEKRLGIDGDYQYKALRSKNFIQSNWHANKLIAIAYFLNLNKESTLLDIGTGSGNLELLLANKVKKIIGVDYNNDALNFLRSQLKKEKISNVKLILGDLRELDKVVQGEKFDFITMIDVIEHVDYKDGEKLTRNLVKLLNPGGKIIIITPNYKSLWAFMETAMDFLHLAPHLDGEQHLAKYDSSNLAQIFRHAGIKNTKIKSFNLFSYLSPLKPISTLLCKTELLLPFNIGNLIIGIFEN